MQSCYCYYHLVGYLCKKRLYLCKVDFRLGWSMSGPWLPLHIHVKCELLSTFNYMWQEAYEPAGIRRVGSPWILVKQISWELSEKVDEFGPKKNLFQIRHGGGEGCKTGHPSEKISCTILWTTNPFSKFTIAFKVVWCCYFVIEKLKLLFMKFFSL